MEIYVNISFYFHIFFFSGFQSWFYQIHWFYSHVSSSTATDHVTN